MKVLIVIDMINGFCRTGYPLSLPLSTKSIEEYIENRIKQTIENKGKVIFLCDSHQFKDPEINDPYPPHCMTDTEESEIIEPLKKYIKDSIVLTKNTLSIFYKTGLEEILKTLNPVEIEISGVCTDICVLFAIYELRIRGYKVFVNNKGVLPLEAMNQDFFLDYFGNKLGAKVIRD